MFIAINSRFRPSAFLLLLLLCLVPARAQEDPNAQYILLQSDELTQAREIDLPIEVGALRVQITLQASEAVSLTLFTPLGKPLSLFEPNISVSQSGERRTILMWDPRPGAWKLRLSGRGRFNLAVTAQGEVYVCCVQLWGRAGVMMFDRFQPALGSKHQAQLYASGVSIQTIEFFAIDDAGRTLSPIKFRQSDLSNPYSFTLLLETPDRPFRVLARGRDLSGKNYQRVIAALIRPVAAENANETPATAAVPIQVPQEWNTQVSEGEYRIARAQVVSWSDEPLRSAQGNQIGLRLKYSIRFAADGSYAPLPQVYPERIGYGYTGALSLRIHKGTVAPVPEGLADAAQIFQGARGIFKRDTIYQFIVDLVPNYLSANGQSPGTFCLMTRAYNQPVLRERFEREIQSEIRLRYRLSIPGTDFDGRQPSLTENSYLPSVWQQSYAKEGIVECP